MTMRVYSRAVRMLAATALTVATIGVVSARADAATIEYQLQLSPPDSKTGKHICLDADGNHAGAGAPVNLVTCSTSSYQKWRLTSYSNGFPVVYSIGHPGYCMDVSSLAAGHPIALKACTANDHAENWAAAASLQQDNLIYNWWSSNLVFDAINPHNGYQVYLENYGGGVPAQTWRSIVVS